MTIVWLVILALVVLSGILLGYEQKRPRQKRGQR